MNDPVANAVMRTFDSWSASTGDDYMTTAAREALAPIREVVADMRNIADHGAFIEADLYAYTQALERLCFTSEELA